MTQQEAADRAELNVMGLGGTADCILDAATLHKIVLLARPAYKAARDRAIQRNQPPPPSPLLSKPQFPSRDFSEAARRAREQALAREKAAAAVKTLEERLGMRTFNYQR